jgi:hypothetical protein
VSPEGGFFADLHNVPSWEAYRLAARSLVNSLKIEDPEDTLMVQLTFPEVCAVTLALVTLGRFFPEMQGIAADLSMKLREVSDGQEFLSRDRTLPDE